jgi:hypothetical protein
MWAQFKIDFTSVHQEFRLTNQTAHQSGFHSANVIIEQVSEVTMQGTVDAIAQLEIATASNRGTVATPTTTNGKLAAQLETSQAFIKKLKEEIANLKANMKMAWQGHFTSKSTSNLLLVQWIPSTQDHTSATCKTNKYGH